MKVTELALKGALLIEPKLFEDNRGFFFEWFNKERFSELTGNDFEIKQINFSRSSKGVFRGLHFQKRPMDQAKLIAAPKGEILDVIVDLRNDSPTFGNHLKIELSEDNKRQLFIPKGFAHGFLTMSDSAEIMYGINNHYSPAHDSGVKYDSHELAIDLGDKSIMNLSEKDLTLPDFKKTEIYF